MTQQPADIDPLALARPVPAGVTLAPATITLPDGYETAAHVYEPCHGDAGVREAEPIIYFHGIQSHPAWFSGSAGALAAAGFAVVMPARRGSGANRSDRGDAKSAAQLLDDVAACCRWAMDRFRAARVRLVGVSWGGKLAAAFRARGCGGLDVASLTMIAPGIVPQIDVPLRQKLAIGTALLGRAQPGGPRGTALFDIPLSAPALFTDNPEMRAYLAGDIHRLHQATARFFYASSRLDSMLRGRGACINGPTTLVLAQRDRIIDNAATRRLVERLTAGRVRVVEFEAAHTIDFEPAPAPFYEALVAAQKD